MKKLALLLMGLDACAVRGEERWDSLRLKTARWLDGLCQWARLTEYRIGMACVVASTHLGEALYDIGRALASHPTSPTLKGWDAIEGGLEPAAMRSVANSPRVCGAKVLDPSEIPGRDRLECLTSRSLLSLAKKAKLKGASRRWSRKFLIERLFALR